MDVKVAAGERLAINLMIAAVGGVIVWDSQSLHGGSAYFPLTVGFALIALSVVSVIHLLRHFSASTTSEASLPLGIVGLVLAVLYLWSAQSIGFITSALWFLPLMALLGGERRWPFIAGMTLCFALLAWLVFGLVFAQTMPPELIFGEVE